MRIDGLESHVYMKVPCLSLEMELSAGSSITIWLLIIGLTWQSMYMEGTL